MNSIFGTFPRYMARQFLFWVFFVFFSLSLLFALFDFVELMRRASGKSDVTLTHVLQMSLFKLPHLLQDIFPFVMLFGALVAFWRLSKTSELVIARAAGFSVWKLLTPILLLSFLIGAIQIAAIGPLSAQLYSQYEKLETRLLKRGKSQLSLSQNGFWLRQGNQKSQEIIYAQTAQDAGKTLKNATTYLFDHNNDYIGRVDAETAVLADGHWNYQNATIVLNNMLPETRSLYKIPTSLTHKKILDSFSSEDTMSFWNLPEFINTLENAGFDANNHKMRFHSLLSTPFLLCAMVLIAATFAMRVSHRTSGGRLILSGISCGFLLYFFTNIVQALGLSTGIPIWFSAWMPAVVSLLLGLTALLHTEDG